jgi:shikimate kinase
MVYILFVMNISLIGMSGVGKSTVGKLLAERLDYTFIDVDKRIEQHFGKTLEEIVDELGEQDFIEAEKREVQELGALDETVIAPGGSVAYSPEALTELRRISKVIYLSASSEWILQHTKPEVRGIVGLRNRTFLDLHRERAPLYEAAAHTVIEVSERSPEEVVEEIFNHFSVE